MFLFTVLEGKRPSWREGHYNRQKKLDGRSRKVADHVASIPKKQS